MLFPDEKFCLVNQYWKPEDTNKIEKILYADKHHLPYAGQMFNSVDEYHDPQFKNAIIKSHDGLRYYENQNLHRLDGFAVDTNHSQYYYFHGLKIDAIDLEDFKRKIKLLCLK